MFVSRRPKVAKITLSFILFSICMLGFFSQALQAKEKKLTGPIVNGLLSGKYSILMRHALAPGTGDPQNFQLKDCATQRNLSPEGRKQAEAIGKFLRGLGVTKPAVFTSQWCRCIDTAELLGFPGVRELPIINSFFRDFRQRDGQTEASTRWLKEKKYSRIQPRHLPVVFVTHQVNITALTGVYPRSGEMVIVELSAKGEIKVVARWETDD